MVTPQTNIDIAGLAQKLCEFGSFAICGHVSPDGDALGSVHALAWGLRSLGKHVDCLLARDEKLDDGLSMLPGVSDMIVGSAYTKTPEAFVVCDAPSASRIGTCAEVHDRCAATFTIDHHAVPERYSDFSYTDPDAPATCMIVWDILKAMGVTPDATMATCALTGTMTDTNRFTNLNTTSQAFEYASEMVSAGANPAMVAQNAFQRRTCASLMLEKRMLENMELLQDSAVAFSTLTHDEFVEIGASGADAEPLIDVMRSLGSVRVACLIRGRVDEVKGSLRAKDATDVSQVAREFGGGGHIAAAGFTSTDTFEHVVAMVRNRMEHLDLKDRDA